MDLREMDSKIYKILGTRNVISLRNLLEENELIFDRFLTNFVSQIPPLHIAIQHGSVELAKEILRRKPQLAYVLSSQGFSPLRMASANGSVDIVRELLPLIVDVSDDRDSKGWTPVHAAAMKGHVDVLKVFNETNPEWIRDMTDRDETVLHLYVKYNKSNDELDAMKTLILLVGDKPDDNEFVNRKDADGNTILHLAAMKKDIPMISYLISTETGVEINAANMNGFTALDVFTVYPSKDNEMVKELQEKGAVGSREMSTEKAELQGKGAVRSGEMPTEKAENEKMNALMLIGTLTATLCFQAALVPPGGLWQDDSTMGYNNLDKKTHTAGTSILADKDPYLFAQFQLLNQLVFLLSSVLILGGGVVRSTYNQNMLLSLPFQMYTPLALGLLSVMIYRCNEAYTPKGLSHDILRRNLNVENKVFFTLSITICSCFFIFNWVRFLYRNRLLAVRKSGGNDDTGNQQLS